MNFNLDTILSDKIEKIAEGEVAVETKIAESEGGIDKVLTLIADSRILSVEAIGNEVAASGRVNFKLIYLSSAGELKNLDYFSDFVEKLTAENAQGKLFAKAGVIDTSVVFSGGIKLTAVLALNVFAVKTCEGKCLKEVDESLYTEKSEIKLQKYITSIKQSVDLADSIEAKAQIQKVLLLDTSAIVTDVNVGVDNVLISGTAKATITFTADDEIRLANFTLPFSEEIACEGLIIGQKVSARTEIKSGKVILSGVEGENELGIEMVVELILRVFGVSTNQIVSDVFSTAVELETSKTQMTQTVLCGAQSFSSKLTGMVSLEDEMSAISDLIGITSSKNNIAKVMRSEAEGKTELIIEGVVTASILYRDENGINSIEANLPYSETFALTGDMAFSVEFSADGIVLDISAKAKRDREIEVSAALSFMTEGESTVVADLISDIAEGAEKEQNKSAVSIFIAEEGEGIWEAAKALSARPDQIAQQNPELELPFKGGEKVIFYRQLSCTF